jgi:hypothetical protein
MKKFFSLSGIYLILFLVTCNQVYSQGVLKKIKDKTEDKIVEGIFGKEKETNTETSDQGTSSSVTNKGGAGLENTAPDVKQNISDAESALKDKNYKDARNAIRQALLGVEIEMGKKVLEGLPGTVNGLKKVDEEDRVTSASIGFVGLVIERVYRNDEKELKFTVGNNAALLSPMNMGAYVATTDQNQKQVKFKGYNGVLEYNEGSGYKLSVPFGQSSIMILEGVNYTNEQEIMSSAEEFDIDKIKKELGEQ